MVIEPIDYSERNEKAYKLIQYLNNYRFTYHSEELFDVRLPNSPITFVGPDKQNEKYIRVIIYGGHVADIYLDNDESICSLCVNFEKKEEALKYTSDVNIESDKVYDYGKFLIDGFTNGRGRVYSLNSKIKEKYCRENKENKLVLYTRFCELIESLSPYEALMNEEFLDLLTYANYLRWSSGDGSILLAPSEKNKQNCIAKISMLNSRYNYGEHEYLVIDTEYLLDFPDRKEKESKKRVDFVVFDGETIGFVEFKYLGGSTENLESHYCDFKRLLDDCQNEYRVHVIEELMSRLKLLIEYGIVDKSWERAYESFASKIYDKSLLWGGFFFLGDRYDYPVKDNKNKTFAQMKQMARKYHERVISTEENAIIVKYQFSQLGHDAIIMSEKYNDLAD